MVSLRMFRPPLPKVFPSLRSPFPYFKYSKKNLIFRSIRMWTWNPAPASIICSPGPETTSQSHPLSRDLCTPLQAPPQDRAAASPGQGGQRQAGGAVNGTEKTTVKLSIGSKAELYGSFLGGDHLKQVACRIDGTNLTQRVEFGKLKLV